MRRCISSVSISAVSERSMRWELINVSVRFCRILNDCVLASVDVLVRELFETSEDERECGTARKRARPQSRKVTTQPATTECAESAMDVSVDAGDTEPRECVSVEGLFQDFQPDTTAASSSSASTSSFTSACSSSFPSVAKALARTSATEEKHVKEKQTARGRKSVKYTPLELQVCAWYLVALHHAHVRARSLSLSLSIELNYLFLSAWLSVGAGGAQSTSGCAAYGRVWIPLSVLRRRCTNCCRYAWHLRAHGQELPDCLSAGASPQRTPAKVPTFCGDGCILRCECACTSVGASSLSYRVVVVCFLSCVDALFLALWVHCFSPSHLRVCA
jgi:hypothetical protein